MLTENSKVRDSKVPSVDGFLRGHEVLGDATSACIARLVAAAATVELGSNELIYSGGTKARHVFIVVSGAVRLFHEDDSGAQATMIHVGASAILGGSGCTLGASLYSESAMTASKCTLVRIEASAFGEVVRHNPRVCYALLRNVAAHSEAVSRAHALKLHGAPRRLAALLLTYAELCGVPTVHGIRINSALTHECLANGLGLVGRSVSRILADWKRHDYLCVRKGWYVIRDRDALEALSGGTQSLFTGALRHAGAAGLPAMMSYHHLPEGAVALAH